MKIDPLRCSGKIRLYFMRTQFRDISKIFLVYLFLSYVIKIQLKVIYVFV